MDWGRRSRRRGFALIGGRLPLCLNADFIMHKNCPDTSSGPQLQCHADLRLGRSLLELLYTTLLSAPDEQLARGGVRDFAQQLFPAGPLIDTLPQQRNVKK